MITFQHTAPHDSFNRFTLTQFIKAILDGEVVQWHSSGRWWTYITDTPDKQASVISDIMQDSTCRYRVLPAAFWAAWIKDADHEGVEIETALEWFLKGKSAT